MIIKSLKLKNIRSYKDGLVEFPLGKTLFEGDVGAGKSTLLMAVEFALFGLGDVKPAALLKNKANEGEVKLVFSVDGKEYTVSRGLERKRDGVGQTGGLLETLEGDMHLSAGEMKGKILEILDFKEPVNPNAQSVIYRYAVFTPQEEMKAILSLHSDLRVQTLRKAFGLEDYKTAASNAAQVLSLIDKKIATFEAASTDLDLLRSSTQELQEELATKREAYEDLKSKKAEAESVSAKLKGEKEVLHTKEGRVSSLTSKIELLGRAVTSGMLEAAGLASDADRIDGERTPLLLKADKLRANDNPSPRSQAEIRTEIEQHKIVLEEAQREDTKIGSKLADYTTVQLTGVCPVCDTKSDADGFAQKVRAKSAEKQGSLVRLQELQKHQNDLEQLLTAKENYDRAQSELTIYDETIREYERQTLNLRSKSARAAEEAAESQRSLEGAQAELQQLENVKAQLEELGKRLAEAERNYNAISELTGKAWQEIEDDQEKLDEDILSIGKKQGYQGRVAFLKEYRIWIEDYFLKTLETIEKHVMLTINQEFNNEFQKWVGILLEDSSKVASVDDTFTPTIEQDGSEQDVRYLSGGERTAVALAYRLALNCVVRRVSTGMKSNLLILDEPTDGFSKEQLPKVREILDELRCPQVIMVSHEKELESFADQIMKVYKVNGESRVEGNGVSE